jgi:hypothetical protein
MPWRWTDPPPKESYQMSKGSISKKENPTPEKGIRKMRKKKKNTNIRVCN